MDNKTFWKNFKLGEELSISGTFIYNGLSRFYELRKLDFIDELFEVLYNLSIGFERLMKIVVVLLEHDGSADQDAFEKSLITHSHQKLMGRIKKHVDLKLSKPIHDLLTLLTCFFLTYRYDRYSLHSLGKNDPEKSELLDLLRKYLFVEFENSDSTFGIFNDERYKKFLRKIVSKLSSELYQIVKTRADQLDIYTDELRSGSKAENIFLSKVDISSENVLWKELLIFFMNTNSSAGYLKFLRGIEPLNFDPACIGDYLDCFQINSAKAMVLDELKCHYEDVVNKGERLRTMEIIGMPGISFNEDDIEEEDNSGEN